MTILFQAMNVADERKGLKYFIESLEIVQQRYPDLIKKVKLTFFGKSDNLDLSDIDIEYEDLGFLTEEKQIVQACQNASVFVIPSLEDNLPNAVIESLACATPVLGFDTGGIPEMVDHKQNGFIAQQRNSSELAQGLNWILEDSDRYEELCKNARKKVMSQYTYNKTSQSYHELYSTLLNKG